MNTRGEGSHSGYIDETSLTQWSNPLRVAIRRILPIGVFLSSTLGFLAWLLGSFSWIVGLEKWGLRIFELSLLFTFLLAVLYVSWKSLGKWFQGSFLSETSIHHERFKLVTLSILFVVLCAPFVVFLALMVIGIGLEIVIGIAETVVLVVTIAILLICSRYAAESFTADVTQLIRETRASSESLTMSYQATGAQLIEDLDTSMNKIVEKLEEQAESQVSVLSDLASAVKEVADVLKEEKKLVEESRLLQERAVSLQEEMAAETKLIAKKREQARHEREEQERLRMMPKLMLRMYHTGIIFHHLKVQILNIGMPGYNLEMVFFPNTPSRFQISTESTMSQERKSWDIGDAKDYPSGTRFKISTTVADARGRRYLFRAEFRYVRIAGPLLDITRSIRFEPSGFIQPKPHLLEDTK